MSHETDTTSRRAFLRAREPPCRRGELATIAAMRPALVALLSALALACSCDRSEPAAPPPPAPAVEAAPAVQPAPPAPAVEPAAPVVAAPPPVPKDWWCLCFDRLTTGREARTVCAPARPACEALELRLAADTNNDDRHTHGCRLVQAAHPGDLLGARDTWKAGSAPDSQESVGACRLEGPPTPPTNPAAADYALTETVGQFRLRMSADQVLPLATPTRKSKSLKNDFDEYEQKWDFPALGLQLTMAAPARQTQLVAGIDLKAPGDLATARGIKIGSTRAELDAAYGELFHMDSGDDVKHVTTGEHVLVFFLEADKVTRIFLGMGGE